MRRSQKLILICAVLIFATTLVIPFGKLYGRLGTPKQKPIRQALAVDPDLTRNTGFAGFKLDDGSKMRGEINLNIHVKMWHGADLPLVAWERRHWLKVEVFRPSDLAGKDKPLVTWYSEDAVRLPGRLYEETVVFHHNMVPKKDPYNVKISMFSMQPNGKELVSSMNFVTYKVD